MRYSSVSESIFTAATSAFLAAPFDDVSVGEIAARAQVSVGSIYHHYGDKAGLRDAVAERAMDMLLDSYLGPPLDGPGTPTERATAHCLEYVRFVEERPGEAELLGMLTDATVDQSECAARRVARVGQHLQRLADLTVEGQRTGEIRPADPSDLVMLIWSSLYGLCMLTARFPGPVRATTGRSELSRLVVRVIEQALAPDTPARLTPGSSTSAASSLRTSGTSLSR